MTSECFGAEKEKHPEFYNKYYTPDGKPRWDVIIANLQPVSPEFEALRAAHIRWFEESGEKERIEREAREKRERGHGDNVRHQPPDDKPS